MAQFTINNTEFNSRMLPGETQAFLAKRLFAVFVQIAGVAPYVAEVFHEGRQPQLADLTPMADLLLPVAREIAALPDADLKFVMDSCMRATMRRVDIGVGWAPVVNSEGGFQHDQDSSFAVRMGVTWNVLRENFQQIMALVSLGGLAKTPAVGNG